MLALGTVILRQLGLNRAGEVRLGRFLSNKKVTKEALIEAMQEKVGVAAKGRHVLAIQDTTEINYQKHKSRVKGLGLVGNGIDVGFFMHPMLVLDAQDKTCLGISALTQWIREDKDRTSYKKELIEKKESFRWIRTAESSKKVLGEAKCITIIADRESDIYEEWARIPDEKTHLIIRACRDRKLYGEDLKLSEKVNNLPVQGILEIEVEGKVGKRRAHKAKLEVRYTEVEIKKSKNCTDKNAPGYIKLSVVDVKELDTVVEGEDPIHWCLLTTHRVSELTGALQIVDWYCARWNIEQLFRTLKKQGLDIESSQVENADALMKLSAIALQVALQTMQLTLAREGRDQKIQILFDEEECQVLRGLQSKLEGKTEKQKNPHASDKLSWASWIIARLGGWKGYKSERPPGPITMARGLTRFHSIHEGWLLFKDVCIP